MSVQDQVDNPMWFDTSVINQDFTRGYCQAVYQMRLKLTSMDQEPKEIREYTEYMIEELNNKKNRNTMTAVEWLIEQCPRINTIASIELIEQAKEMEQEQMIKFAEFVASYPDKNRNAYGERLHAKSKYDGAERTVDLLEQYYNETYGK